MNGPAVVRTLVELGADVNAQNNNGMTALKDTMSARSAAPGSPHTDEPAREGATTVAVVGGGFWATLVAANLLRRAGDLPLRVVLIERGELRAGRGEATVRASRVVNCTGPGADLRVGSPSNWISLRVE